jgi:lipopolysaccharide transport system permease protein
LLFFVTPIVYSPPQSFPFSLIATINPISPLLIAARDLITKGTVTNVGPFAIVAVLSVFLFFLAWTAYRVALPIIIERMSA